MGSPDGDSTTKSRATENRLAHVMDHPVRVQALTILTERTASPKEIARELREKINKVSHHVRKLHELGLIELVEEKPRRGAVEHFYRSITRPLLDNDEWKALTQEEREQFSAWIVRLIIGDLARATEAGTFDARLDRHATRAPLFVDEVGWRELVEMNAQALRATLQVQAASAERLASDGGEGFHVSASTLCIEMPDPRDARRG